MTRTRSDEGHTRTAARLGEIAVLRKKTIARMDSVCAVRKNGADDGWNIEVALLCCGGTDADRLVGHTDMERIFIGGPIDCSGFDVKLVTNTDDSDCDGTTIRYQQP